MTSPARDSVLPPASPPREGMAAEEEQSLERTASLDKQGQSETMPSWREKLTGLLYSRVTAAAIVAVASVFAAFQFFGGAGPVLVGSPAIVVFDPVKLANAERAVASQFLNKNADVGQTGVLLAKVRAETESAIREVAGGGALILVKQAVVLNQYPDITDKVLTKLGLPTDVPTTLDIVYSDDAAPSTLSGQVAAEAQSGKMTLRSYTEQLMKGGANEKLVP